MVSTLVLTYLGRPRLGHPMKTNYKISKDVLIFKLTYLNISGAFSNGLNPILKERNFYIKLMGEVVRKIAPPNIEFEQRED